MGPSKAKRRLAIGIQTFREIREDGHCYGAKTSCAVRLNQEGRRHFLLRPRRFGKSLFLNTPGELFEGGKDLFAGLAARRSRDWDWSVQNPVGRLDLRIGDSAERGHVHVNLMAQLARAALRADVGSRCKNGPERFAALLETLHSRTGQRVVVLVDDYDKPILDASEAPSIARADLDDLRGPCSVIKSCDAHVRFWPATGVSKFSRDSSFAGQDDLRHVTLSPSYSTTCGFTEDDLDTVFAPHLDGLAGDQSRCESDSRRLADLPWSADLEGLERFFRAVLSRIPYRWHSRNEIARYEGYCESVAYTYMLGG